MRGKHYGGSSGQTTHLNSLAYRSLTNYMLAQEDCPLYLVFLEEIILFSKHVVSSEQRIKKLAQEGTMQISWKQSHHMLPQHTMCLKIIEGGPFDEF